MKNALFSMALVLIVFFNAHGQKAGKGGKNKLVANNRLVGTDVWWNLPIWTRQQGNGYIRMVSTQRDFLLSQ